MTNNQSIEESDQENKLMMDKKDKETVGSSDEISVPSSSKALLTKVCFYEKLY